MPDAALFCADLAEDPLFGGGRPHGALAPHWLALEERELLAEHFSSTEPPHLLLPGALPEPRARAVLRSLQQSRFEPHAVGRLSVARAPRGAAARLVRWLNSAQAARLHLKLCGVEHDRPVARTQVLVSRMRRGDGSPQHIDTGEHALTAVYSFSEDVEGGALSFYGQGGARALRVRAAWNQALLFASRLRPHEVDTVQRGTRYTVTALWELGDGDGPAGASRAHRAHQQARAPLVEGRQVDVAELLLD